MRSTRRDFVRCGALAASATIFDTAAAASRQSPPRLADVAARPVLRTDLWKDPVRIAAIDLLRAKDQFLVRVRSEDGATGLAVGHNDVLESTWPILTRRVAPFFIKKDARDLEALVDGVYLANSNYKWQGLPFWVPVASVEFAILDLLGKVANRPLGDLFGGVLRRDVAVYRASGNRKSRTCNGSSPRRARRRSSSASARACVTTPRPPLATSRSCRSPARRSATR